MPNTPAITSHKPFYSRLYPCISCKLSMGCGFPMCRSQISGHRIPLGVNLQGFTSGSPDDVCDATWKQCVDDPASDGWMFFQAVSSIEKSPIWEGRKTTATLVPEAREKIDHPWSAEGRSFGDKNGLFSKTVHELAIIPPNDVPTVKYHLNYSLITFPLT